MGADLIGYCIKADRKITPTKVKRAKALAKAQKARFLKDFPTEKSFVDLDVQSLEKVQDKYHWVELILDRVGDGSLEDAYKHIKERDTDKTIDDFVEAIRGNARDIALRTDPDDPESVMVFAGDMSWGDEPDGFGYCSISEFLMLGVDSALGVR